MSRIAKLLQVTTDDVGLDEPTATPPGAVKNGREWGIKPAVSEIVATPTGTRLSHEMPRDPPRRSWWQRYRTGIILTVILVVLASVGVYFLGPYVREALATISTDDAFVAGHVTNVSPRVEGVITAVLVDQNDRVEPNTLLLRLDREPFAVAAAEAESAREQAEAELVQARTRVRAHIAQARASYYRRQSNQERLRQQVATLKARVATLKAQESSLSLARVDQARIENLVRRGSATQSELDVRNNTLKVADERVQEAWADIQETRAALGLEPNKTDPLDIPADLEARQSTVQTAVSDIAASLAEIGLQIDLKNAAESKSFADFFRPENGKTSGEGLERVIEQAPAVQVARAALKRAERELDEARLRLSYTEIRSEVAGYIQDRSAHPGNRVALGQALLTIRPDYVWVDANYKETQIHYLKIGQPVDLQVDAYPRRTFKGRVAGFSPGTGLSESLLPPENATGNYVKVTQRLPVRIELAEPNPSDTPLFIGLSVVPRVRYKDAPTGPGAGRRLHEPAMTAPPDIGGGPAGRQPQNRPEAKRARR